MRKEKGLLLDEIREKIDSSNAMIVTSYTQLPPNTSWDFRSQLANVGSSFEVVHKRLFLKAAEMSGISIAGADLNGHIGVVFVQQKDAMPSAKTVLRFSGDNQNILRIVYGKIDGITYYGPDMELLSRLPEINELRSQFLALLVSPMSQLLAVFEAAMAKPVSAAEQKG
jgi:large subunit ribosomal protein L10